MTRMNRAQNKYAQSGHSENDIRREFDIPAGVDITQEDEVSPRFIREFSPWIKQWTAGRMYLEDVYLMLEELCDFHHIQAAWVFLEKFDPESYYWGLNRELFGEIVTLGSRSTKKHTKRFYEHTPTVEEFWKGSHWTGSFGWKPK